MERILASAVLVPAGLVAIGFMLWIHEEGAFSELRQPGQRPTFKDYITTFFGAGLFAVLVMAFLFLPTFVFVKAGMTVERAALPGVLTGCVLGVVLLYGITHFLERKHSQNTDETNSEE